METGWGWAEGRGGPMVQIVKGGDVEWMDVGWVGKGL